MSWGERSCTREHDCKPTMSSCNVDCELYRWDGKNQPDSSFNAEKNEQKKRYKMMSPLDREIFRHKLKMLKII
jgi:hypothetical protein